jgi:hypothetical protein
MVSKKSKYNIIRYFTSFKPQNIVPIFVPTLFLGLYFLIVIIFLYSLIFVFKCLIIYLSIKIVALCVNCHCVVIR